MGFTGSCIANDWAEIEGPFHDVWPPRSHPLLFGELTIAEFVPAEHKDIRPPVREPLRQEVIRTKNKPEPEKGIWTIETATPSSQNVFAVPPPLRWRATNALRLPRCDEASQPQSQPWDENHAAFSPHGSPSLHPPSPRPQASPSWMMTAADTAKAAGAHG